MRVRGRARIEFLLPMDHLALTFSTQLPPSQAPINVMIIVKEIICGQQSTHARFLAHILWLNITTTLKGNYDYCHRVEEIETQGG